eukprot:15366333-Ditylum_brightwellii.AAC.1
MTQGMYSLSFQVQECSMGHQKGFVTPCCLLGPAHHDMSGIINRDVSTEILLHSLLLEENILHWEGALEEEEYCIFRKSGLVLSQDREGGHYSIITSKSATVGKGNIMSCHCNNIKSEGCKD